MAFATALKHFSLRVLPDSLLQPMRKAHYARKLQRLQDEPEMSIIRNLLSTGGCAVDIGANVGLYARFLANIVGLSGHVHAVEPIPATCDVLVNNVNKFGLNTVTVHNVAISDRCAPVAMAIPHYAAGGENHYEAHIVTGPCRDSIQVPAVTLDSLFGRLGQIDFVKCDVEGHELQVLRGAASILHVHRPAWLIEVAGDPDVLYSNASAVVELMRRAGYQMFHLAGADTSRTNNYFFLRPEHVRRLSAPVDS